MSDVTKRRDLAVPVYGGLLCLLVLVLARHGLTRGLAALGLALAVTRVVTLARHPPGERLGPPDS